MKKKIKKSALPNRKQTVLIGGISAVLVAALTITLLVTKTSEPEASTQVTGNTDGSNEIKLDGSLQTPTGIALQEPQQQLTPAQIKASDAYKNAKTNIPYDELFRNSEDYKGQYVRYTGKVIQVLGEPGEWNLRVNITKEASGSYDFWDDTVFVYSYSQERVIDDDIIEFTALVNGTITYKSVMGGDITVPSLTIYEHKLVGRAD